MTTALVLAGFACIAVPAYAHARGLSMDGHGGMTIVAIALIIHGLPFAAACYLFTLATGWSP